MGRRRTFEQKPNEALRLWESVLLPIATMEANVIYATVPMTMKSVDDIVNAVFPMEVITACKASFPFIREYDKSRFDGEIVLTAGVLPHLSLFVQDTAMVAPRAECAQLQDNDAGRRLYDIMEGINVVVTDFDRIRALVKWFDKNATLGALRYYWPSVMTLLPNDHAIHPVNGRRFREPDHIGSIIPECREAGLILTRGVMCPMHKFQGNRSATLTLKGRTFALLQAV